MKHALTIDVEDFFHVGAFSKVIQPEQWASIDGGRVVENTQKLLSMFKECNYSATFFVLGWVADKYPDLVKQIHEEGFEVASHGWSHQLVYTQTEETFYEETKRSKECLEGLIGRPVRGYRAASYSITSKSVWALDILADLGFEYDSSLFPVKHDVYGMPGTPFHPYHQKVGQGRAIAEFPLSTYNMMGYRLPIAGGGYFRLFPYWFSKFCFKSIESSDKPFVFYLHPWEIDPEQPRVGASLKSKFRHYNNLSKCENRLRRLLKDFEFDSMENVLADLELLS